LAKSLHDIITLHYPSLVRYVRSKINCQSQADDILHDALCQILKRSTHRKLINYGLLFQAIRCEIKDHYKAEGYKIARSIDYTDIDGAICPDIESRMDDDRRLDLIKELDDMQRDILKQRFYGVTQSQIAQMAGISQKSISVRLQKIRVKLQTNANIQR
jgi:RNA polymerase sigma factor (sigma-70 family)